MSSNAGRLTFHPRGKGYEIKRVKHTKADIISRKKEGLLLSHLTMLSFKLLMFFSNCRMQCFISFCNKMSSSHKRTSSFDVNSHEQKNQLFKRIIITKRWSRKIINMYIQIYPKTYIYFYEPKCNNLF